MLIKGQHAHPKNITIIGADDTEEEVEPVRERNTAGDNVAKSQQKPNLGQAQRKQTPTPAVTPTTLIKAQTKRGSARKQR